MHVETSMTLRTREDLNSESVFQDHRMHACGHQQDSQDKRSSQRRGLVSSVDHDSGHLTYLMFARISGESGALQL